ncbi:hypothetical protein EPA93_11010 [Ktedonosporobacter rubrisoli]|uniref:Uncharacterized protein n=1 Tax=Ktedonosporobacter rubrisoli TaxID=2509675 RepID=A0A4P6JN55_KTERU|nr:hypothetical protein [Ktedonosporobacter rubrisoli]QBD76510.1 hypothetical protein EPA93_11010 [Ktedonosporobacter rubrisoli]
MFKIIIDLMLGAPGRALEALYLNHEVQASLLVLAWMIVVFVGLRSVSRMRSRLRIWVTEILPQYDPDDAQTPERILQALEPRWNEAAATIRFMPTKRGLWTQRATADGLREPAGFTVAGIERLITRIIRRPRNVVSAAAPSPRPTRSARPRQRSQSGRTRQKRPAYR